MNFLIKLLAPFLLGLFRKFGPRIPGIDHAQLERSRKRLVTAMGWLFAGALLFVAGLMTGIIDSAVQYEQHGGVEFNVVLISALAMISLGLVGAIIGKIQFPSLDDFRAVARRSTAEPTKVTDAKSRPGTPRRPGFAH